MRRVWIAFVVCSFASLARTEEEAGTVIPSPDKKWEYRLVENQPAIVNVQTGATALDFDAGTALATKTGRVVWAPDSRRLAFNYRAGARYYTCAVYELAGDEWKALPDLETKAPSVGKMIEQMEERDRKRLGVGRDAYRRRIRDEHRVRRWIDPDTFEAIALSEGSVVMDKKTEEVEYIGGAILFTVKCDNKGGWKIIRQRELPDAELEKMGEEEAESPAD